MTEPAAAAEHDDKPEDKPGHEPMGHGKPIAHVAGKKIDKKQGIAITLAAAGVLLAYLTLRKSGGSSSAAAADPASSATDPTNYPITSGSSGFVDGSGSSDGSASDGLSTYMQNLSNEIDGLTSATTALSGTIGTSTTSGTTAAASPFYDYAGAGTDKYVKNAATGAIYQVDPDGQQYHLNPTQWAAIKAKLGKTPVVSSFGKAKPKAAAPKPVVKKLPVKKPAPGTVTSKTT